MTVPRARAPFFAVGLALVSLIALTPGRGLAQVGGGPTWVSLDTSPPGTPPA